MHILVSFCNRTGPGDPALGLLDADFSDFRVLKLPAAMSGCIGVTGLATCGRRLYIVAQALPRWQDHPGAPAAPTETAAWVQQLSPPHLFMFDLRTFSLRSYYAFQSAQDVHSIAVLDNDVYAVSSGTDAVIKLGIRDGIVLSEW